MVPPWDIGFVLETLCKYPFEPLNEVPLKFLTFKTLFLISAASGRRRSFIHALSVDEGHIRWDKDGVSLIPAPGFLAKNESINYLSQKVFLPKMSKVSSVIEDQVLCPCRALKRYLKATEGLRAGSKKLFISYKTHKPITRDTISNWIVKTIKMSYDNLEGVRAHDVRSLSTSWALFKSVPVNEIMEGSFMEGRDDVYVILSKGHVQQREIWKDSTVGCLSLTFGKFFRSYSEVLSKFGEISFQEYVSKEISYPVFFDNLDCLQINTVQKRSEFHLVGLENS